MKNYNQYISEQSSKFVTVNYKIIKRDHKTDQPELLVTDFEIKSSEDNKVKIKGKGYELASLNGHNDGKKKKGWVAFDDFKDDTTRMVWHKHFENGTKKIKVYL